MRKIYAGIGSRKTPAEVLEKMRSLAKRLAARGYTLRSGAADGADAAFEQGCDEVKGKKDIWIPWSGFNNYRGPARTPVERHYEQASQVHPAWARLGNGPRALHARNIGQIAGHDLATPVDFVLCWTPDGCESEAERNRETGGTGTAIAYAASMGIPVFNLGKEGSYERFVAHVLAVDRKFHQDNSVPVGPKTIFVFGSNLAGRHGKGAALVAKVQFGAIPGIGRGRMGASYGIPTKAADMAVLGLEAITEEVEAFISYAKHNAQQEFFVTRVGCGLAGFKDEVIAPLFLKSPTNCSFAEEWKPWLGVMAAASRHQTPNGVNIFSGGEGLGAALTNMTERAYEKGCLRNHYPVKVGDIVYPDSEAAYQALKVPGAEEFNDKVMVDILVLKFLQHPNIAERVAENGGAAWLTKCTHFTRAASARAQSWEGAGLKSRFILNLVAGYEKALLGLSPDIHLMRAQYLEEQSAQPNLFSNI